MPTLDGNVRLHIKEGTQPDSKLRLRGKGIPKYNKKDEPGDLIVLIKAEIPALNEKQKELIKRCKKEGEEPS